jgi:ectoine hydroxylase-related dioxygenase (phytanoyl-CoA dioxygenase family)
MKIDLDVYQKTGVIKVENVFNADELKKIDDEVARVKEEAIKFPKGSYVNFADSQQKVINSIHRIEEMGDTLFKRYATHKSILEISEKILGKDPILFSIQLFLKPAEKGLATPAHQDNAYWNLTGMGGITIWVALDCVDASNGAVQFLSGSHLVGNITHIKSENTPGSSKVIDESYFSGKNWVSYELSPGDCTVHGGLNIHRSGKNESGRSRRALLFNFKAKDAVRDEEAFKKYNNDLEAIHGRI